MSKGKFANWKLCLASAVLLPGLLQGQADSPAEVPETHAPAPGLRLRGLAEQVRAGAWEQAIEQGEELLEARELFGELALSQVHYATALARAMQAAERPAPSATPSALAAPGPIGAGGAGQAAPSVPVLGADYLVAVDHFESSRALAGAGELRLAATYDAGTSELLRGDLWRAEIPEVAQAQGQQVASPPAPAPPATSPPGAAGPDAPQPPDPLAEARTAYQAAKEGLLNRLRADWRDGDTRANLELIQRRLRELDEIEAERKQQEQESKDSNQDSEDQDQKQDGEPGDEGQDQDKQEQDKKDQGDQNGKPEDQKPEDDPGEDSKEQESPADADEEQQPSEEEQKAGDGEEEERPDSQADGGQAQSAEQPPAERVMTREEVIRLLDKLSELEEEAQAMEAAKAKARTVRVDRDW